MLELDDLKVKVKVVLLMVAFILICCFASVGLAPNKATIKSQVETAGYTDVVVGDLDLIAAAFYCGEDDGYYYPVEATNAQGQRTQGMYVCAGIFKGSTIRFK